MAGTRGVNSSKIEIRVRNAYVKDKGASRCSANPLILLVGRQGLEPRTS